MKTQTRFQVVKKTIKVRAVSAAASDPRNKLDCIATGGSIVSTVI